MDLEMFPVTTTGSSVIILDSSVESTCLNEMAINVSEPYESTADYTMLELEIMLLNKDLEELNNKLTRLRNDPPSESCEMCVKSGDFAEPLDLRIFQEDHRQCPNSWDCINKLLITYAGFSLTAKEETPVTVTWIPDEEADTCMCCNIVTFSTTQRKHHCRRCGRIVCGDCSKWKKRIPQAYKDRPVRQCNDCLGLNRKQEDQRWHLFGDARDVEIRRDYKASLREPDVGFSLALLNLCSNDELCKKFLRFHCKNFDDLIRQTLKSCNVQPNPQLCTLLINSLLCLTMAAKVRDPHNLEWNFTLAKVQIMKKLSELNLTNLIPTEDLSNTDNLRRLRDNLLEVPQLLPLAFDTSLLCGLSTVPVLLPWGLDCLRTGKYQMAREKLSMLDGHRVITTHSADHLAKLISIHGKYPDELKTFQARPKETPQIISEALKQLRGRTDSVSGQEKYYYLFLHGSHKDILKLMVQERHWPMAFRYILDQSVPFEDFLDAVILSSNEISEFDLVMLMRGADPGLEKWEPYLKNLFWVYEKKNILATLYNLQAGLGDDIRAALTSIKFYTSNCSTYRGFLDQSHYLDNAEFHFKRDLKKKHHQQLSDGIKIAKKSTKLVLESSKIQMHLRSIALQKKISRFLAPFEDGTNLLDIVANYSDLDRPVSIFDYKHIRSLVILVVSCDLGRGYQLANEILSCYASTQRGMDLNQLILDYFTAKGDIGKAVELIQLARVRLVDVAEHDCMDSCIMETLTKRETFDGIDRSLLAKLVESIRNTGRRIEALIKINHLKSAYLLAVETRDKDLLQKIAAQAELTNQLAIKRLCERKLKFPDMH